MLTLTENACNAVTTIVGQAVAAPGAGLRIAEDATSASLGLFVVEAMSVIIQVFFYKRTGKRVFKMAPIHHHFEQLGWSEPTVVIRFWIIALVLALAGLSTLKVR